MEMKNENLYRDISLTTSMRAWEDADAVGYFGSVRWFFVPDRVPRSQRFMLMQQIVRPMRLTSF
jgi:hypothetical protein